MFEGMFNFLKRKRRAQTARYVPTIVVEKDDSEKDSPMCSSRISPTTGAVVFTALYSSSPELNVASSSSSSSPPAAAPPPSVSPLSPLPLLSPLTAATATATKTKSLAAPPPAPAGVTPSLQHNSTPPA